jgi:hypothetical protein
MEKGLFKLGEVTITNAAEVALRGAALSRFKLLNRHIAGDFGVVQVEDAVMNRDSIKAGYGRVLSSYILPTGVEVWVETQLPGGRTTILLPEDYFLKR